MFENPLRKNLPQNSKDDETIRESMEENASRNNRRGAVGKQWDSIRSKEAKNIDRELRGSMFTNRKGVTIDNVHLTFSQTMGQPTNIILMIGEVALGATALFIMSLYTEYFQTFTRTVWIWTFPIVTVVCFLSVLRKTLFWKTT